MKTKIVILLTIFSIGLTTSCTQEDNSLPQDDPTVLNNTLTENGAWIITYFWDSDHEETNHFNGYQFTFGTDGVINASDENTNVTGTWSSGTDDSQLKLYLNFTVPTDFEELSDDWHILESSDTKIRLEDVSGGNGVVDYLTFERS